jgi:Holliday junction resolvase RusA-like endonuclease
MRSTTLLTAMQTAIGVAPAWTVEFRHDGAPQSKARARVVFRNGKMSAHTPKETRASEDALAWRWKFALQGKTHDGPLAVACVFVRPNYQRIDTDNMIKLVLDAGTKARAWLDDSQVVMIVARTEYDPAAPRTEITLMPTSSTMDRPTSEMRACAAEGCGKEFAWHRTASRTSGEFCSNACAQRARRVMIKCARCPREFRRLKRTQRFCSHACASAMTREEAVSAGKRSGPPTCEKCGGRVSRREYKQCAKCLGRGRPAADTSRSSATDRIERDE